MCEMENGAILRSFFELETKRECSEPSTKRQKVDDRMAESMSDEQLLMRIHYSKLVGPTEVTLSPMGLYNSRTELTAESLRAGLNPQDLRSQLHHNLQQWEKLHQREEQLIQKAKQYLANFEAPDSGDSKEIFQHHQKFLASEINSFVEHRTTTLGALFEASNFVHSENAQTSKQESLSQPQILLVQQPAKTAVVNRYISPAPSVEIQNFDKKGSYSVSVSLLHHDSEEGVQDILQGTKRISLDSTGKATFSKIKITEISPRHRQQPFSLLLSLEDYSSGEMKVLATAKSDSFHIQSRPTSRTPKRRREEEESKYYGSTSSDEDYVQNSPRERAHEPMEPKSNGLLVPEYNYVDITEYLTLPQKEAATRLGISESMLCKRFKECTRRKWPYRYIRKIDKVINMLCAHQDGQPLSPEDKKKLDKLVKEREERLQPVKIRITAHDRTPQQQAATERSRSPSPSPSPMDSPSEAANFNDEEQFVLETLEMLKTQRSPKD